MDDTVFKGNPTLETERLILRRLTIEDEADIFAYASDEKVPEFMLWDVHKTIEDARNFIRFTLGRYESDEAGEWGIVLKETGRLIGCVGFVNCDTKNKRAETGYVLNRNCWGKGYMPEAVKRVIEFAFSEMGLNRIESYHFLPNKKSGRVMQKAGMIYEGTARQKVFAKERFWDAKQYAILKEDWEKGRKC